MLDIGFWELLVIAIVLLLVMGPERLPDVAKQAAFFIRKARTGLNRLRFEMQAEMQGSPLEDLQKAKQEVSDLKSDLKKLGKEFVDSAEKQVESEKVKGEIEKKADIPEYQGENEVTKTDLDAPAVDK